MPAAIALDFDGSLATLSEARRFDLADWQQRIRLCCGWQHWRALEAHLAALVPEIGNATVLVGSGDYHHVSHLLLKRLVAPRPVELVVFDNHPDNMRFPFGIHCGSWVAHAARLPQIARIHVLGISSGDVGAAHAWENHLRPLYSGKLSYWTCGVDVGWAKYLGLRQAVQGFDTPAAMISALHERLSRSKLPAYLSVDKDALAPEVAHTNWDQGRLQLEPLLATIALLKPRLIGSDITGEVSIVHYEARWKRLLSSLDAQPEIPADTLAEWQAVQLALNRRLLAALA